MERNWGYRCELTLPQIELMQSDLPHTLFLKKKKNIVDDDAVRLQMEANKKAEQRRKARQQKEGYTVDEIFGGEADN